MRRARVTYHGAFHHVMSRGYEGRNIFKDSSAKDFLVTLFRRFAARNEIKLLGWCILDNHYHLILRNDQDQLSRFMKEVNGTYGRYYRMMYGGKGAIFDGRFKSTVIENDEYLRASLLYLFQNPVRAGLALSADGYSWSSMMELTDQNSFALTDRDFILEFLGSVRQVMSELAEQGNELMRPDANRWGETLGQPAFRYRSLQKLNRRQSAAKKEKLQRIKDRLEERGGRTLKEFCLKKQIPVEVLSSRSRKASRLRKELILLLRDECGLRLMEIHQLEPYRHLALSSLGKLYHLARQSNDE